MQHWIVHFQNKVYFPPKICLFPILLLVVLISCLISDHILLFRVNPILDVPHSSQKAYMIWYSIDSQEVNWHQNRTCPLILGSQKVKNALFTFFFLEWNKKNKQDPEKPLPSGRRRCMPFSGGVRGSDLWFVVVGGDGESLTSPRSARPTPSPSASALSSLKKKAVQLGRPLALPSPCPPRRHAATPLHRLHISFALASLH